MPNEDPTSLPKSSLLERYLHGSVTLVRRKRVVASFVIIVISLIALFLVSFQSAFKTKELSQPQMTESMPSRAMGVCPPFPLRDEAGNVIDPAKGVNDTVPYSPRQTCGASGCHDYAKITEGLSTCSRLSLGTRDALAKRSL